MHKHFLLIVSIIALMLNPLWVKSQTLDLGNDTILCNFNGFTLDAGVGFSTYLWSNNATTQTITLFSSQTVSVTVTDAQNNIEIDQVDVYMSFPPIVNFEFENNCVGEPIQFLDNSTSFFDPLVIWHWDFGDGFTSADLNPIHIYDTSGIFQVTLTVTNSRGCDSFFSELVEVYALPFVDAGIDTTVNLNEPVTINPTVTPNASYLWNPPVFLNNDTIANPIAIPSSNVTYTLTVTDSLGCFNSDEVSIFVNFAPIVNSRTSNINPNANIIFLTTQLATDPNNDSLTFNITSQPNNGNVVFSGNTITYTPNENFSGNDTIFFEACDTGIPPLCTQGFIVVIVGNAPPVAVNDSVETEISGFVTFNVLENDTEFNAEQKIEIDFISDPTNGKVDDLNNGNLTYTPDFGFTGIDSFFYVICDNGQPILCDTATVYITVNNIPLFINNSFSPNGDGVFDNFIIEGIISYPQSKLLVFNRWGEIVFETIGYKNDFDGFTGFKEELPDATYYYYLDLKDGTKPLTGYLVLKR